jgi:hypothetical protein
MYENGNKNSCQKHCIKKFFWLVICIAVSVVLWMLFSKDSNMETTPKSIQEQKLAEEFLLLPNNQKQGSQGITPLNADPQVKEGW